MCRSNGGSIVPSIYRRSLLYLVSNGLEGRRKTPNAGMQKFAAADPARWTTILAAPTSAQSRSSTRGGFDNDPATVNTILSRVCGRRIGEGNGGFTKAELLPTAQPRVALRSPNHAPAKAPAATRMAVISLSQSGTAARKS